MSNNKQKMNDDELKARIHEVLKEKNPTSLTELGRELGWGTISGSQTKRIRTILPDLEGLLKKNVALKELDAPKKPSTVAKKAPKKPKVAHKVTSSKYPRHPQNVYREGSGYALCFDILASEKGGWRRDELVAAYAKESGKEIGKGATWDTAVILSATDSNTGPRHRSARDGYWVRKEENHVTLVVDKAEKADKAG